MQPDSSIFLRVDEDRFDVMRAMITGPKGTPYECGCFEFDILLPPDYPNSPPKVHFLTTGSGRVRFNPNLYQTGKVCLSLLGTWAGPGWNPKTSTLLQVKTRSFDVGGGCRELPLVLLLLRVLWF